MATSFPSTPPPLLRTSLVVPQPCPVLQSRGKLPDDTALSDVQKGKWPCSQDHAQPGPAPTLCPGAGPARPRGPRTPPAEGLSGEGRWAPTPAFSTCSLKGAPLPPCHVSCHSQQEGPGHLSESIHIVEPQHRGWRRDWLVMPGPGVIVANSRQASESSAHTPSTCGCGTWSSCHTLGEMWPSLCR